MTSPVYSEGSEVRLLIFTGLSSGSVTEWFQVGFCRVVNSGVIRVRLMSLRNSNRAARSYSSPTKDNVGHTCSSIEGLQ